MKTTPTPTLRTLALARALALVMNTALAGATAWAENPASRPPEQAVTPTDAAVWRDRQAYQHQQAAIHAISARRAEPNTGDLPAARHSLAKAQCWLDASFHEYTRNDRSSFPRLAFEQSTRITRFLAADGVAGSEQDPAQTTAMINNAARLRTDLWQRLQSLVSHDGAECAQAQKACAEVQLVHAGHEYNQLGWRHAKPYLQIAEDTVTKAETLARQCRTRTAAPADHRTQSAAQVRQH